MRMITCLPKHTRIEELYRYAQLRTLRANVEAARKGNEGRLGHCVPTLANPSQTCHFRRLLPGKTLQLVTGNVGSRHPKLCAAFARHH